MIIAGEILQQIQSVKRLHEIRVKDVCEKYGLSEIESSRLMFLHNNPCKDTASDIVELRMLPKANVSKAVELLIQKGLLQRRRDVGDRRRIHLMLTENAQGIMPDISNVQSTFLAQLFDGFTMEEKELYADMNVRIAKNAIAGLGIR